MKPAKVKELLSDTEKLYMITLTSVQKLYGDKISNIKIDMENEVIEFDSIEGLHFVVDMTDINMIVTNPEGKTISGLYVV